MSSSVCEISASLSEMDVWIRVSSSSIIWILVCCSVIFSDNVFWYSSFWVWSDPKDSSSFCFSAIFAAFCSFSVRSSSTDLAETGMETGASDFSTWKVVASRAQQSSTPTVRNVRFLLIIRISMHNLLYTFKCFRIEKMAPSAPNNPPAPKYVNVTRPTTFLNGMMLPIPMTERKSACPVSNSTSES